jgi:hypothetical protein
VRDETPANGIQISNDGHGLPLMMIAERLARIETTLEGIRRDRDEMVKWIESGRDDHEKRIRGLERWKYMLPSALVTGLVSAGVTIYGQIGR